MSKVKSSKIIFLAMVFLFTSIIPISSLVASAAPAMTSDFKQLNASQLVSAMGAGWNLGNQLEANISGTPNETAWGNPTVTKALIQKVKATGFKTIRIPVSYLNKIGSAPNYTIDAAWLARVKEVVDYAYSEGLYVIVNIHGDGYHSVTGSWLLCDSSNQTTIKAKYQKVWQQIANTFVNYNERLIFESMNEEFDGTYGAPNTTYYANINAYNQIFVDTVRQAGGNNSARWLLIPGWNTNIDYTAGNYGFVLPTDTYRSTTVPGSEKRIMISVHYYSPWDFCGEESGTITQWGATSTNSSKKSTWGQEDYLNSQLKMMYDKFVTQGYPVVIGEFGSIDKTHADSTNNTYRSAFAKAVCSTAKKYGSVPVYWDNGYNGQYGFGLFNRSNYAVTQQGIIDAIMSGMGATPPVPDTTAPTAPLNLISTGKTSSSVSLSWGASTDNVGVTGYNVYYGSTLAGTATSTNYTVIGLAANTSYTFTVKAKDAAGNLSAASNGITVITDTSTQVTGNVKVQMYNGSTAATVNSLTPRLKLVNTGTTAITLSNVKIRYYYTIDAEKVQSFACDWSTVGGSNVTGTFVKMATVKTGADYYLEIGFTSGAGNLAAGQSIDIQIRGNKTDWSNYTQTGDYSFNSTSTAYVDWSKVTAYVSGSLKWGREP